MDIEKCGSLAAKFIRESFLLERIDGPYLLSSSTVALGHLPVNPR
jgi:hypothetical protein